MKNSFTLVKPFKTVQNNAKTLFSAVFFENRSKQCGIWFSAIFSKNRSTRRVVFDFANIYLIFRSKLAQTYVQHTFNIRSSHYLTKNTPAVTKHIKIHPIYLQPQSGNKKQQKHKNSMNKHTETPKLYKNTKVHTNTYSLHFCRDFHKKTHKL